MEHNKSFVWTAGWSSAYNNIPTHAATVPAPCATAEACRGTAAFISINIIKIT